MIEGVGETTASQVSTSKLRVFRSTCGLKAGSQRSSERDEGRMVASARVSVVGFNVGLPPRSGLTRATSGQEIDGTVAFALAGNLIVKGARNVEGSCGRQGYRRWVGVIRARGCFGGAWALVRFGHHHIDTVIGSTSISSGVSLFQSQLMMYCRSVGRCRQMPLDMSLCVQSKIKIKTPILQHETMSNGKGDGS